MFRKTLICHISLALFLLSGIATAEENRYGNTYFEATGSEAAHELFMEGVLMLHSFEYDDARDAFQKAQEIDPDFVMAYWGEALTHYKRLWYQFDVDAARDALSGLGSDAEKRAAKAQTEREGLYLASVEGLFGAGSQKDREAAYAEAMGVLSANYPDDENAKAFYSLALMWTEDGDNRGLVRSAAVAEELFASNPLHPGGLHYLIHAYDTPVLAPLGLRAALVYDEVAPAAAHALHMPSHIFVAMGMWERSTNINIRSLAAATAWGDKRNVGLNGNGAHATQWLQYSLMQQGRFEEARQHFVDFQEATVKNPARLGQFTEAYATYMAETNYEDTQFAALDLDTGAMSPGALLGFHFTRGASAAKRGDSAATAKAKANIEAIEPPPGYSRWSESKRQIALLQIDAFITEANGDENAALAIFEQAAKVELTVLAESGLPSPVNPSPELYGEKLLEAGQSQLAAEQFEATLQHYPGRSAALLGLARATQLLGNDEKAIRLYEDLYENWKDADDGIAGLDEVNAIVDFTTFSDEAIEVIKAGIHNREARDPSSLVTFRIEIDAGPGFAYSSRKLGREEHHVMLTDEPATRGGTDTSASPLGLFVTGLGTCVVNQFNRLAVTADLDLQFTSSTVDATFSGEEGGDFKEFVQNVYARGGATANELEELTARVDGFCRISVTLQKSTPMTTVLHVNGEEVSRRSFRPNGAQE
jgi:tetratricopeptide (TPR) repeat protein/uncharacterized OsmC-like protein